ncbi:MAG: DUF3788 family protein [Tissierellia bacterium]|nr:DUF3788 family protein [Tissierellia bacterium]
MTSSSWTGIILSLARIKNLITSNYDYFEEWHSADKGKAYELKFRIGSKTIVSMFPHFPIENSIGIMIIYGKTERDKFESTDRFSKYTLNTYYGAKTYGDGKWIMFQIPSEEFKNDFLQLLAIKRKSTLK